MNAGDRARRLRRVLHRGALVGALALGSVGTSATAAPLAYAATGWSLKLDLAVSPEASTAGFWQDGVVQYSYDASGSGVALNVYYFGPLWTSGGRYQLIASDPPTPLIDEMTSPGDAADLFAVGVPIAYAYLTRGEAAYTMGFEVRFENLSASEPLLLESVYLTATLLPVMKSSKHGWAALEWNLGVSLFDGLDFESLSTLELSAALQGQGEYLLEPARLSFEAGPDGLVVQPGGYLRVTLDGQLWAGVPSPAPGLLLAAGLLGWMGVRRRPRC